MPEPQLKAFSYWVVRYTPNLVRDEWLNVGVLLLDPARPRVGVRFIEENAEYRRVLRLHLNSDETILRALERHFETVVGGAEDPRGYLAKLGETLSNVVQLSPERGLLAENFEEELDRLYQRHVAPPPRVGAAVRLYSNTRAAILGRFGEMLRRAGLAGRLERRVKIEEFTYAGDPLRLDYAYQRNGTRGFVQALSLERDASQAKVLAYTAERIRERLTSTEFTVITETAPQADNERHQFFARLLGDQRIAVVPLAQLDLWVNDLRGQLLHPPEPSTTGLKLKTQQSDEATVIQCAGRLTFEHVEALWSQGKAAIRQCRKLVLDLGEVTQMDSAGLGAVVGLYVSAKKAKRDFLLTSYNNSIKRLLGISRLLSVFEACA